MPEISTQSSNNAEFARVIEVAKLRGLAEFPFDLAPGTLEAELLARLMDALAVKKMRFTGRLLPGPKGSLRLEGDLGATVIQTCVVTLDPVTTRIEVPVRLNFVPETSTGSADVAIAPFEEDDVEPLGDRIDLGLVAIEALALALPPYPRRKGAELGFGAVSGPEGASNAEAEIKPFAALATLRDKLGGS